MYKHNNSVSSFTSAMSCGLVLFAASVLATCLVKQHQYPSDRQWIHCNGTIHDVRIKPSDAKSRRGYRVYYRLLFASNATAISSPTIRECSEHSDRVFVSQPFKTKERAEEYTERIGKTEQKTFPTETRAFLDSMICTSSVFIVIGVIWICQNTCRIKNTSSSHQRLLM